MGIFKRASEVVEAKVSKLLNRLEDPNEMLDLSYEKMVSNLQEVKRHLADVVTEQKSLDNQVDREQNEVRQYEESARDRIALQAEKLKETEQKYRDRIDAFRTQKEVSKATYSAAKAQVKVSESVTGIGRELGGVGDILHRAQDKTDQMVARASAMDSLTEEGVLDDPLDQRDKMTRELAQLRKQSVVEGDLERLKKELGE